MDEKLMDGHRPYSVPERQLPPEAHGAPYPPHSSPMAPSSYGSGPPPPYGGQMPQQPQQGGYMQSPHGVSPNQAYVITQPGLAIAVQTPLFGDNPCQITCPNCRQTIVTYVTREDGTCTYIWCFALFLTTFFCFWLPFVCDCNKDVRHNCPACHCVVGYRRQI